MKAITLLEIGVENVESLQKIGEQTFYEAFSENNSVENMSAYLKNAFSTETLLEEISNDESQFYFAKLDDEIIGYLKINFGNAQTELKLEGSIEIQRIYVLQKYIGQKVGQVMLESVIDIAKRNHINFIWLGVWEKNMRALNFYKKNGFIEFDRHSFMLGDDMQTDIMMKLIIT